MRLHMSEGHIAFDRGADTNHMATIGPQGSGKTITMSNGHTSCWNIAFRIGSTIGAITAGLLKLLGLDLTATSPKFINIFRGTYITSFHSLQPWKLVNSPTVYLSVMGGYMVFLSLAGIERYLNLVRRRAEGQRSCQSAFVF